MRKKLFAWMSPKAEAEGGLAVHVDADEKQLLIESNPAVYYSTPHYEGYPASSSGSSSSTVTSSHSGSRTHG